LPRQERQGKLRASQASVRHLGQVNLYVLSAGILPRDLSTVVVDKQVLSTLFVTNKKLGDDVMRFTVRGLLIYVFLASLSLALTQVPFLLGCGLLVLAVILANFLMSVRTWRFLVYGALVGILTAVKSNFNCDNRNCGDFNPFFARRSFRPKNPGANC
jgi:hypothetical protein